MLGLQRRTWAEKGSAQWVETVWAGAATRQIWPHTKHLKNKRWCLIAECACSEDHLCLTRYVCPRVPCERRFLQSSSWVMGRSKGPHACRLAKEGRKASNGMAYSFQQVLCLLPLLPPPDLSLIAFLTQTHWTSAPLDLFLWWRPQCNRGWLWVTAQERSP